LEGFLLNRKENLLLSGVVFNVNDSTTTHRSLIQIVLRNTAWVTFGSLFLKVLNFLFNVYVIRSLGDERFGQYAIVTAFPGLFAIFIELGMTQYVMREISRDRTKANSLVWNLIAVRLLLAIFGVIAITAAAAVVYEPGIVLGVFLFTFNFVFSAIEAPLESVLTANERFDYMTLLSIVGRVTFMALGTIFLFSGLSFHWLIVAGLVGVPTQIAVSTWAIYKGKFMEFRPNLDIKTWPIIIRGGFPFGMISLALSLAFSIDTVILSFFEPDRVVGWYQAAYNLVFALMFVSDGFSTVIVPTLTHEFVRNPDRVRTWYYRSVKIILLISVPMAVGGMVVAEPMILFLYGEEFLPSVIALQILIWDVPFLMFNAYCGNITTVIGKEKEAARIYSINAVANIVLNIIFIPLYGMIAAAVITVVTDLIGSLQFHYLLRDIMKLPNMTSILVRVIIASAGLGLAVYAAGELNWFILIGIGIIVYGILALLLRLVSHEEWALVQKAIKVRRAT
jgi:O-antigen/teichoic acid export membrane protein